MLKAVRSHSSIPPIPVIRSTNRPMKSHATQSLLMGSKIPLIRVYSEKPSPYIFLCLVNPFILYGELQVEGVSNVTP